MGSTRSRSLPRLLLSSVFGAPIFSLGGFSHIRFPPSLPSFLLSFLPPSPPVFLPSIGHYGQQAAGHCPGAEPLAE